MGIENYLKNREQLMKDWADEAWDWIGCKKEDAVRPTFYRDGVFDTDVWFRENNSFKPLFILKEVHEESPPNTNPFEFVVAGEEESDPWKGKGMWGRLGTLAVAMFKMNEKKGDCDIPEYYSVQKEQECVQGSGESRRQEVCRKIAIINLKKIGGGAYCENDKSKSTFCFTCHAQRFYDKLIEQIYLINPTVIICCGKDSVIESLGVHKDEMSLTINGVLTIPVINGYHPQQTKTEDFYYRTLKEMQSRGLFKG